MQDLTTGPVSRHLLKTTSFMLVTMVFQTLYFLVDLYWVGRLGKEAVAAVSVAGNLTFVVLAITQMLAVGGTTLISHATGRRDHPRALLVFNQAIVLSALVGALYLVVMLALQHGYAEALSADHGTASAASAYLLWFIPATSLQFLLVAMSGALRGTGNFRPGMIVQTATVIINIVLAPILIFGWGTNHPLGVAGAAIATLVAVAVGTVWLATFFFAKDSYLRFTPADWKPDVGLWGRMLQIGLPSGTEFALIGANLFVVYTISRPFGAAAQAGLGIGLRIIQAGFMPVVALGFAVAPVAGQNFGARRADRVRETFRTAVAAASIVMLVFALLSHVATASMIRIFSSDPGVVAVGEHYLRIVSWSYVGSGIVFVCSSMFQAIGNTWPSLIASLIRVMLVAVPAIAISHLPGFQLHWIWYLSVTAVVIQTLLCLFLLRREFRRRLRFDTPPHPGVVDDEAPPAATPAIEVATAAGDPD